MAGPRPTSTTTALSPLSTIPDKLYFKIGEVAQLVGVEPHVLRYWEREVASIRPTKSPSNQRRYRRRDIELFREIRRLLYEERYTLAGAKKQLVHGERPSGDGEPVVAAVDDTPGPSAALSAQAPSEPQLRLGFPASSENDRLERVRAGLRDLIRLAGEEP